LAPSWQSCRSISRGCGTRHGFADERRGHAFVGAILLAFLPAAVIGVMAHGFIKTVLVRIDGADLLGADRRRNHVC
jgi:undecaprenyl pyrophosphate phosphatase UppP